MKRILMMALAAMMMVSTAAAQTTKENKEKVYEKCEVLPEYPGGELAMFKFLADVQKYPEEAVKRGEQGRVVVSFVVEKDGSLTDIEVTKHATPTLDKAAVEAVKKMPKWKPGMNKGKKVRVQFALPITYRMN